MYRKKSRQCCAAMLIVSVCLRLCMFLGLDARLGQWLRQAALSPQTAKFLLYLETGQVAEVPQPEPEIIVVEQMAPVKVEMSVRQRPPVETAQAEELSVVGQCSYSYDKQALLEAPTTLDFSGDGPHILIVHAHTSEAYSEADGLQYTESSPYRTLEEDRSVVAVGEALAQALREHGLEVIHDKQVNDYPNYNTSYWNCLQRIEQWQERFPNLQMIIDVHRDAVEDESGNALALLSTQQGQQMAQLMLVVGTDEGGLEHPNWQMNLANALKLQSVLEGEYPGLCRKLDLRTERFNQHACPGSILVEVGTNGNTLTQAKASAVLLADAIAKTIGLMQR